MNLEFSEEQHLLTNMVEKYTSGHYDVNKRAEYINSKTGFSQKNWDIMAETGILSMLFSETYGGLNGSAEDLICVMRPLGKAVAVDPMLSCIALAGNFLNNPVIDHIDHIVPYECKNADYIDVNGVMLGNYNKDMTNELMLLQDCLADFSSSL